MNLASFRMDGRHGFGFVEGDTVVDLSLDPALAGCRGWAGALSRMPLGELRRIADRSGRRSPRAAVRFDPVVTDGDKILCVGLNFRAHAAEAGLPVPDRPALFARFPSSFVGHGEPVLAPRESAQFDYEGELAVVIGRAGRRIPEAEAAHWVLGYTILADNSVRDWQAHSRQVTPGKNFHRSGAMGPWCVTADAFGRDPAFSICTRLNGRTVQAGDTGELIFSIPALIAYASAFAELRPGDVIATGTPAGVGMARTPPLWLAPGDRLDIEIDGIGTLTNPVEADA